MSGLFGLIDPDGVDARSLEGAAEAAAYRGKAEIFAEGSIAVGVMARPKDQTLVHRTARSDLVIDGRIDAVMTRVPIEDGQPAAIVDHILATDPEQLSMVAAEFALARADRVRGSVMLARDVFGLHPLYVAGVGRRFGFASDPAILFHMGVATDELDPEVVAAYLARSEPRDGRTAFLHVTELLPGHWMRVDGDGRRDSGRWFVPERIQGPQVSRGEAVEAAREVVGRAIVCRTSGGRVGISLSGGRDSSSVAVSAAAEGIDATCLTQTFDSDLPEAEESLARQVAERSGLVWQGVPVSSAPTEADIEALPQWSGTPLGPFAFPQSTAVPDAAEAAGLGVVLYGEGGEPLFTASDVAILDLVRSGHPIDSMKAARAFHEVWGHPYSRHAKVAARAMLPRSLLGLRERVRAVPPWVEGSVQHVLFDEKAPRSDRHALRWAITYPHPAGYALEERLHQFRGIRPEYPLLDLRVVSLALSLRLVDRAPIEAPKPILAEAFLGDLASSRVKRSFVAYYERLSARIQQNHADLFRPEGLACKRGFLRAEGLAHISEPEWIVDSLGIVALEAWLQQEI